MCISNTDQARNLGADHRRDGDQFLAGGTASGASLGTTAKSVRQSEGRHTRFRHQRHAARLLGGQARVGLCRWSVVSKSAGVDIVRTSYAGANREIAHYEGLQTCGSVWACPCCGARISETRRDEMNQLLAWARLQGYRVMMLTLTARHGREDDLAELLDRMKDAKGRWARHRSYRQIKGSMVGSVTATEVTAGHVNGWHPHFHVIVILDGDADLSPLRDAWLASLRGAGLDGAGAAFQAQGADAAGRYITKWGAAEELSLGYRKKGRAGRTPAQLLAASCDEGDREAGHLWAEYATVFHGRRQLVWSRGLKTFAGIGEVDDQEAAQDQHQDSQLETGRSNIPHRVWCDDVAAGPVDRRAELLDRAEEVGPDQAAEELLAGHMPSDDVIEHDPPYQPRQGGLAAKALAAIQRPKENVDNGEQSPELALICDETAADEVRNGSYDTGTEAGAQAEKDEPARVSPGKCLGGGGPGGGGSGVFCELARTCDADRSPSAGPPRQDRSTGSG